MAYTWTDGELITAEKLNETGGGVLIVNETNDVLNKTWQEIHDALANGSIVLNLFSTGENDIGQRLILKAYFNGTNYEVDSFLLNGSTTSTISAYLAETANDFPVLRD